MAMQGARASARETAGRVLDAGVVVGQLGLAVFGLILLITTTGRLQERGGLLLFWSGLYAIAIGLRFWARSVGVPPSRVDEAYITTLRRWFRTRRDSPTTSGG
jgi:hypothetical protein